MLLRHPLLRLVPVLVVGCLLGLGLVPAAGAATVPTAVRPAAATTHDTARGTTDLHGDAVAPRSSARRSSVAWRTTRLSYFEATPAKWHWSLSTAVAKWNASGSRVQLVRTTDRRLAKVTVSYGSIGQAAGMATVGRTAGAYVKLSNVYAAADEHDAHNRVEVMGVFAHELGHVLGFEHTTATCSLMSPVLDISGCGVVEPDEAGYYRCRTIDAAQVTRLVRLYGGRARLAPDAWCLIDPVPSSLSGVVVSADTADPVTIRWASPTYAPDGSRVLIRTWSADACLAAPTDAQVSYSPPAPRAWSDTAPVVRADAAATSYAARCYEVQLVNRYDVGRAGVARLLARPAA